MMCGSDMRAPFLPLTSRRLCVMRVILAGSQKQVEAITALLRERDVFVCLPTGYAMQLCTPIVSVRQLLGVQDSLE